MVINTFFFYSEISSLLLGSGIYIYRQIKKCFLPARGLLSWYFFMYHTFYQIDLVSKASRRYLKKKLLYISIFDSKTTCSKLRNSIYHFDFINWCFQKLTQILNWKLIILPIYFFCSSFSFLNPQILIKFWWTFNNNTNVILIVTLILGDI